MSDFENNIFNEKDTLDINELASLNEDISTDLLDELQKKLTQEANSFSDKNSNVAFDENDDTTLFEEVSSNIEETDENKENTESVSDNMPNAAANNFDDNFIKKYQAKLNKSTIPEPKTEEAVQSELPETSEEASEVPQQTEQEDVQDKKEVPVEVDKGSIETITKGNIVERNITKDQIDYSNSLDYIDGNVKYSKYVIYIDPQNEAFIDSLTVKERKNIINKILKEQNDIAITKYKFRVFMTIMKHLIAAVLTIAIAIPMIYYTINAALEASINNYARSQTNFKVLYKQNGKINQKGK